VDSADIQRKCRDLPADRIPLGAVMRNGDSTEAEDISAEAVTLAVAGTSAAEDIPGAAIPAATGIAANQRRG
jgi:hypothetical protein